MEPTALGLVLLADASGPQLPLTLPPCSGGPGTQAHLHAAWTLKGVRHPDPVSVGSPSSIIPLQPCVLLSRSLTSPGRYKLGSDDIVSRKCCQTGGQVSGVLTGGCGEAQGCWGLDGRVTPYLWGPPSLLPPKPDQPWSSSKWPGPVTCS